MASMRGTVQSCPRGRGGVAATVLGVEEVEMDDNDMMVAGPGRVPWDLVTSLASSFCLGISAINKSHGKSTSAVVAAAAKSSPSSSSWSTTTTKVRTYWNSTLKIMITSLTLTATSSSSLSTVEHMVTLIKIKL